MPAGFAQFWDALKWRVVGRCGRPKHAVTRPRHLETYHYTHLLQPSTRRRTLPMCAATNGFPTTDHSGRTRLASPGPEVPLYDHPQLFPKQPRMLFCVIAPNAAAGFCRCCRPVRANLPHLGTRTDANRMHNRSCHPAGAHASIYPARNKNPFSQCSSLIFGAIRTLPNRE